MSSLHNDVFLIIRTIDDHSMKFSSFGNVQTQVINLKKVSEVGFARFLLSCLALFFRLLYLIKKERIDIVYIRSSMFDFIGAFAGVLLGRPAILEVNAPYWASFSIKWSDAIVTSSEDILRESVYGERIRPDRFHGKVFVTMWGANVDAFNPKVDGSTVREKYGLGGCPVIVYSGGFSPWNDLENLLKAGANVLKMVPDAKFLIVGGSGSEYNKVYSLACDYGLLKSFIFVGKVSHKDVPLYIAVGDICVAPYILKGQMMKKYGLFLAPLKIFEYMAAGKPIVSTDLGNVRNMIEHERTGLLVKPDDPEALANAIVLLIEDRDRAEYLAINARKESLERFTWAKHAQWLDEIFRKTHKSKFKGGRAITRLAMIFLSFSLSVLHTLSYGRNVLKE